MLLLNDDDSLIIIFFIEGIDQLYLMLPRFLMIHPGPLGGKVDGKQERS